MNAIEQRANRTEPYLNLKWVAVFTAIPIVIVGAFVLLVQVLGFARYDAEYFAEVYRERYDTPGSVARGLEQALRTDDHELMAALQGLRQPQTFYANPNIRFVIRLDSDAEGYLTYLYFDTKTFERYAYQVEEVDGRYVVAPEDLHFNLSSGRWRTFAAPLAFTWWTAEFVVVAMVLLYRYLARQRAIQYGR